MKRVCVSVKIVDCEYLLLNYFFRICRDEDRGRLKRMVEFFNYRFLVDFMAV